MVETSRLRVLTKPMKKEVSVPDFFRCPISLELMRDPVTLCTGQTFDRISIEKWFEKGHSTCPATMQILDNTELVPNHTLRRLIQDWCVSNRSNGVERIPTPKQPADPRQVQQMLEDVAQGRDAYGVLRKLRNTAKESDRNRRVILEAGAIPVLGNFVFSPDSLGKNLEACEEALGILALLPLHHLTRKLFYVGPKQLTALSWLLCRGSLDGRINAALLVASLAADDEMRLSIGATAGVFEGLFKLLKEDSYARAIKAGLKAFLAICGPEKNREKAVESGVVSAIVELLPGADRSNTERALVLLELLCSCSEGRSAASSHALTVPVLVRIILRVSDVATEHAVSCLWAVYQHSPKECVDQAAEQAGVLTQLLHLAEVENDRTKTRQRAMELLRQLRHRWKYCDHHVQAAEISRLPSTVLPPAAAEIGKLAAHFFVP
ncbi:hypothetical protein R1sor_002212 [Riccia sorocarpa]|uniref:RING-type E3 ubiquitin transferase n=1 Tax=Riccia sorocarpa TaxID=122646 RepID=A0ABD3H1J0_9MARC